MFWSQAGVRQQCSLSLPHRSYVFDFYKHNWHLYDSSIFCTEGSFPAQLNIMEENIEIVVGPDAASPGYLLDYPPLSETHRQHPKTVNQLAKPCGSEYFSVPAKIIDVTREKERPFLVTHA